MTVADHLLAGLLASLCLAQLFVRFDPAAYPRALLYRAGLVSGLFFAALPLLAWVAQGRPPARFGLGGWLGDPLPALALALLWTLLLALAWRLAGTAPLRQRLAAYYGRLDYLLPRSRRELRTAWLVSVAAACGEEIAFRGFLIWYGAGLAGPAAGLAGSTLLFAAAHAYQRRLGMAFAALAGLALGLAYLVSSSLLLAMAMHAAWNVASFALGRRLLAGGERAGPL